MDQPVTAIYDANVLYPAPLRDLLIRLAQAGIVRGRWTDAIHAEWIRNVLHNNPSLAPDRIARTRRLMDSAVRDCLVADYEHLIDDLRLPDPNDRHVLAAAIQCKAEAIVTFNLKDFPDAALRKYGVIAVEPDDFLLPLIEAYPETLCRVIRQQQQSLRKPPVSLDELLKTLESQGLTRSIARLLVELL